MRVHLFRKMRSKSFPSDSDGDRRTNDSGLTNVHTEYSATTFFSLLGVQFTNGKSGTEAHFEKAAMGCDINHNIVRV